MSLRIIGILCFKNYRIIRKCVIFLVDLGKLTYYMYEGVGFSAQVSFAIE